MLKHINKILILFIELVGVAFFISVGYFVWRLYSGPISINPAIPYITEAINIENLDVEIDIDKAYLTYNSVSNPIVVQIVDLEIYDSKGIQIAKIPEVIIDFSFSAIIKGQLFPKNVIIPFASLRLRLTEDGKLLGYSENDVESKSDFDFIQAIKDFIAKNYNPYFEKVDIQNAEIQVLHKDVLYEMPAIKISAVEETRATKFNVEGLAMVGVQGVNFKWDGVYDRAIKTCETMLEISPFNPNLFQAASKYEFLEIVNMTLGVKLSGFLKLDEFESLQNLDFIEKASFELSGHNGVIKLPFLDKKEIYNLDTIEVKGNFNKGLEKLSMENIKVTAPDGVATGNVSILGIDTLAKEKKLEDIRIEIDAKAPNLKSNNLKKYWPESIGPDVREWLHQNISGGTYKNASFKMIFVGTKEQIIDSELIDGTVDFENATVKYIDGMPKVTKANGYGHVTLDKVDVFVKSGMTENLKVQSGKLSFTKIREPQEYAEIDLKVAGPLQEAVKIIDNKPFEYMKELRLNPADITGDAVTDLKLFFPLDMDLSVDKVKAQVDAKITNTKINNAFMGVNLDNGVFDLKLNNDLLVLSGKALIRNIETEIIFKKYFTEVEYPYEYQLKTQIDSELIKKEYQDYSYISDYIKGELPIQAIVKLDENQKGIMQITSDLINANLDLGFIGWNKETAKAGILEVKVPLNEGAKEIGVKIFDKKENNIEGFVSLDETGEVSKIFFDAIKGKKTDMAINLAFEESLIQGSVTGSMWDIESFSNILKKEDKDEASDMKVVLDIKNMSFGNEESYKNVTGDILISKTKEDKISIKGITGVNNSVADFNLVEKDGVKDFSLLSSDAGSNLRILGILDNVRGGDLILNGKIAKDEQITGKILVKDFNFMEAPALVKLLSLASFTGIVDSLQGSEGVKMSRLEAPYLYKDGLITVTDAYTYGSGFGITSWGDIDFEKNSLKLQGSVVPAYTLNRLLSHIPLFGNLFASEKGSGLLNFSYLIEGEMDAPAITVNPLAVFTPGMIKGILDAGEGQQLQEENKQEIAPPTEQKEQPLQTQ